MLEYRTLDHLATRIETHQHFSEVGHDVEQIVLDVLLPRLGHNLLDVGCGTGSFLRRLLSERPGVRVIGLDTSEAALTSTAGDGIETVLADACAMPFMDDEISALTARHMLYHVPQPEAALREFARVVAPGGPVVITLNAAEQLPRINEAVRAAVEDVLPASQHDRDATRGWMHTDAARLPDHMATSLVDIELREFSDALVFNEPEPVVRYAATLLGAYGVQREAPETPLVVESLDRWVRSWFARHGGPWHDPKGIVLAVGTVPAA